MGGIISRINLTALFTRGQRSQQDDPSYIYSLNKTYFSNYFLMGGERFEVDDPDYLFGDSCDLNFLSCSKPFTLPYKRAQQNLVAILNSKQKANNKAGNRVNVGLTSPLNFISGRHRHSSQCQKHDAQTQTLNKSSKCLTNGNKPSQPLIMLINIRKETLRLVKSSTIFNIDSDLNSLSNSQTTSIALDQVDAHHSMHKSPTATNSNSKLSSPAFSKSVSLNQSSTAIESTKRLSTNSSHTTAATIHQGETSRAAQLSRSATDHGKKQARDPVVQSSIPTGQGLDCASSSDALSIDSGKSGYTSVRDVPFSVASDDDDHFEDALNDATNLSSSKDEAEEDEPERLQQEKSLLKNSSTKESRDTRIPTNSRPSNLSNDSDAKSGDESSVRITNLSRCYNDGSGVIYTKHSSSISDSKRGNLDRKLVPKDPNMINRVYNIEFQFDAEVDCSIRIFYFCTREVNSSGVIYKPQHATYKSKAYIYKKGLGQKFEQQEHTFQPYLFDEDLLIYKPLDTEGNYNSGAVFPIVIHCVALDGPQPRQSQSLVATVEKSSLDESYSIKPLKQLIFVDGVQYILQDIYGMENKTFPQQTTPKATTTTTASRSMTKHTTRKQPDRSTNLNSSLRSSMNSIVSGNFQPNLSDTASIASGVVIDGSVFDAVDNNPDNQETGSLASAANQQQQQQLRSLTSENNSFECVICMSEERDTMLLPCRHLCLCSSCSQSLRYQANTCPICRCPFKAALNLRIVWFKGNNNNKERRYRRRRQRQSEENED